MQVFQDYYPDFCSLKSKQVNVIRLLSNFQIVLNSSKLNQVLT